jgi:hypothetical protein
MEGRRNFGTFAVTPETGKVTATAHDKCLVKMERHYMCVYVKYSIYTCICVCI